ncbi:MAG: hypothetical protein JNK82_42915 [Myxococcaceae bacterium]|nr:hypothetical protein [Myxococcaceae bacterium]
MARAPLVLLLLLPLGCDTGARLSDMTELRLRVNGLGARPHDANSQLQLLHFGSGGCKVSPQIVARLNGTELKVATLGYAARDKLTGTAYIGCASAAWFLTDVEPSGDAELTLEDGTGRARMVVPGGNVPLELTVKSPADGKARVGQPLTLEWSPPLAVTMMNLRVTLDYEGTPPNNYDTHDWETMNPFQTVPPIVVDEAAHTVTFTYPMMAAGRRATGAARISTNLRFQQSGSTCENASSCEVYMVYPLVARVEAIEP